MIELPRGLAVTEIDRQRPDANVAGLRVLVVWPPQVLSYFNAGHHTALYAVAGHLRKQPYVINVRVADWSVQATTWKEVADVLYQGSFDLIAVMNDFDGVDGLPRFLRYAHELAPSARLLTFGRLSGIKPELFRQFELDGIVAAGDYEAGVQAFAEIVATAAWTRLPGVHVRGPNGDWLRPAGPGSTLPPEQWALPDVAEIPYAAYDRLYADDQNKFCGIPVRRELVIPVARGCPIGCEFCEVHVVFGRPDRRLSVEAVLDYIDRSAHAAQAEYVSFYAPTFTLDRRWVLEFCDRIQAEAYPLPWKCATTVHHLDEELVQRMGAAGCVRISVGVETLDPAGSQALPRAKRKSYEDVEQLNSWCAQAGIELNCFVIVGLPGTQCQRLKAETVGCWPVVGCVV